MKFTFLGTGTSQGVPVIACSCAICQSADPRDKRLRTAGLLQSDSTSLVFDTGPDFRQQMLREQVRRLDAVVFTHQHKDHVAGLDDVRAFNFLQRKDMPIYALPETLEHLRREFYYIFAADAYPGVPRLQMHELSGEPFRIGDIDLIPVLVMHAEMKVFGYRIGPFAYITDASYIPPDSMDQLRGLDFLVLNALRKRSHHSHFNLDEALAVIAELQPREAYLTHISHLLGAHAEVSTELPDGVFLAQDGLILTW